VASINQDTPDLDALVDVADGAMYIAKKSGGDRIHAISNNPTESA
jgi:GGDEF domain-containing protein